MIKEIVQFTNALPSETFSRNLELKEGLYMFLEKTNDQLVVSKENTLWVNKKTDKDYLYAEFLELYSSAKMITNKSMNSSEKIFIDIGSPYCISISGKGVKPDATKNETFEDRRKKQNRALDSYLKAVEKFMDFESEENTQKKEWFMDFQRFATTEMFGILDGNRKYEKENKWIYKEADKWIYKFKSNDEEISDEEGIIIKDTFTFYFFMKEPTIEAYNEFYNQYLASKVFLYDLKKNETHGISNDLNVGNISKKPFIRHKTASFEINYKVNGEEAKSIYKFFKLRTENKVLPNPCPIFVDADELNKDLVAFQQDGKPLPYSKLIQELISKHTTDELQNYYLLFFHGGLKGSKIIDIDFVPAFRYKIDDIKLKEIFSLGGKFSESPISNVFQFQSLVFNKIFNDQLIPKNGTWIRFFDDIEPNLKYFFTEAICNLMMQYRKAIYDYIYKSRQQSITCLMFDNMMKLSILEDIRIDVDQNRGYAIKEKLNIWFNLYNYFTQNKNREDMASRIPELLGKMKEVVNSDYISFSDNPTEFAFGAGQLVYFLLTKSAASNKSYAMLEPFLQKTKASQLQDAISNTISVYKHEIDVSKGRFEKLASEVLAYETDINMKNYLRYFLAGCFAKCVIYEKKENIE